MITEENHIHDLYLIKGVVTSIFDDIKKKYDYEDHNNEQFIDSNDGIYVAIEKNEIVICVFISKREAYELCFLFKGDKWWKRLSFRSFESKIYPPFSKEEELHSKEVYKNSLKFTKYSYEWYHFLISTEIEFMVKYYQVIFLNGRFPI